MQKVALLHEILEKDCTIDVKTGDSLDYFFVLFADTLMERRIAFHLADGARANVRGVILGSNEADITFETDIVHRGRNTEGCTTVKGILSDHARANVIGWIRIPETGHNTNAFLEQRFLLLSKHARTKAEPMLEILANDVKASHAATVSRIDNEQLFYLQSRGIDPEKGKRVLTEAFVHEMILQIPDLRVQEECREKVRAMLL